MTEKEIPPWLKKILGRDRRELTGTEYDYTWTLLQLIKPWGSSNNQHTWTDSYRMNGKEYEVTYGINETPIIEEVGKL